MRWSIDNGTARTSLQHESVGLLSRKHVNVSGTVLIEWAAPSHVLSSCLEQSL